MSDENPKMLFWCDLETTGLYPETSGILELAYELTTFEHPYTRLREPWASGSFLVDSPAYSDLVAARCDDHVVRMHDESGLRRALDDGSRTPWKDVRERLEELAREWPTEGDARVVIAGFSVGFDLRFLRALAPVFASRLSYRVFDVSAMSMLCRSLGMPRLTKRERHRAAFDVEESIEYARTLVDWLQRDLPGIG